MPNYTTRILWGLIFQLHAHGLPHTHKRENCFQISCACDRKTTTEKLDAPVQANQTKNGRCAKWLAKMEGTYLNSGCFPQQKENLPRVVIFSWGHPLHRKNLERSGEERLSKPFLYGLPKRAILPKSLRSTENELQGGAHAIRGPALQMAVLLPLQSPFNLKTPSKNSF